MARKIVITSGKGGVGKTTVCANLGIQLANLGYKVVMLDADIGLNNLDVVMGVENKVTYDVLDVIDGKCRISQALISDSYYPSLFILPSARAVNRVKISGAELKTVVEKLRNVDFVLVDCPAGIDVGFHRAVCVADEAYVVVNPALSSLRDADKVLNLLGSYKLQKIKLVINRMKGDLVNRGDMISAGDISRLLKTSPAGIIPEDDEIAYAINTGYSRGKTAAERAFAMLADNIANQKNRMFDYTQKQRGIFDKLRSILR